MWAGFAIIPGEMVGIVEKYLAKRKWRDEVAQGCRQFAKEKLAWPLVVQQHLQVYRSLVE